MELVRKIVDIALHLDRYLGGIIQQYGIWTYSILFVVIFVETGLVIMPFLPGDSLLFAAGTFAALGALDIRLFLVVLAAAAVVGDTVNYWIGHRIGRKAFSREDARFFKKEYLDRTHAFYEKHGGKTIIIARFVPIVRTFVPFVCGLGRLTYARFLAFSVLGALLWVGLLVPAGFFFGNLPMVKNNLTAVILLIVVLSLLPGVVEYLRARQRAGSGR
jgi:membrane-associated protein